MSNICSDILSETGYDCSSTGTETAIVSGDGQTSIRHVWNMRTDITVSDITVLRQLVQRNFLIEYHGEFTKTGNLVYTPGDTDPFDCRETTYTGGASINESVSFLDTEIIFLDHFNGIMVWKEVVDTCEFLHNANKQALFRAPYGSFYSWWVEVKPTRGKITTWKLLLGGVIRTLHEVIVEAVEAAEVEYNILFPLPPSTVSPDPDPDKCPPIFYDYFIDEELQMLDGGQDWWYPDWVRDLMGINTAELVEKASARYGWWLDGRPDITPQVSTYTAPSLPSVYPSGNVSVDGVGNVLLSFMCGDKYVNKLFIKTRDGYLERDLLDNQFGDIPGSNLRLYPVSII